MTVSDYYILDGKNVSRQEVYNAFRGFLLTPPQPLLRHLRLPMSALPTASNTIPIPICMLCWLSILRQHLPQLVDTHALHRQHAVLQTVQVLAMDRRNKLPGE